MSNLTETRKLAKEYPGSYVIQEDGGRGGVSWVRYSNPNNVTPTEYIEWKIRKKGSTPGREGSLTCQRRELTIDVLIFNDIL